MVTVFPGSCHNWPQNAQRVLEDRFMEKEFYSHLSPLHKYLNGILVQNDVPPAHKIPWNLPYLCHDHYWYRHLDSHSVETVCNSLVFHSPCLSINLQPQDYASKISYKPYSPFWSNHFQTQKFCCFCSLHFFSILLCQCILCVIEECLFFSNSFSCLFHSHTIFWLWDEPKCV